MDSEEKISFFYTGSNTVENTGQNLQYYREFQNIGDDLSKLNLNRGGNNTYGFVFEDMHAASKNIQNIKTNSGEVIHVLDDNSKRDFVTTTAKGGKTYQQAKAGYNGTNKYKITKGKYKGQTIVVDKNNKELIEYLEKRGIRYEESGISNKEAKALGSCMQTEGKIRKILGKTDNTAPITAKLYEAGNQLAAASQVGINTAKSAAALAAGMSFGKNMYAYIEGNKDLQEVLFDTVGDATKAAIGGFVGGTTSYFVTGMISESVVRAVTEVIVKTTFGTVLVSVGEITADLSATAGPVFLIGMAIGAGCAMCKSIRLRDERYRKKMAATNRVLSQALSSMKLAYNDLNKELKDFCDFWNVSFDRGFEKVLKSVSDNDFKGFSEGLDIILQVFDAHVLFKTEKQFDDFFFDDLAILNL